MLSEKHSANTALEVRAWKYTFPPLRPVRMPLPDGGLDVFEEVRNGR